MALGSVVRHLHERTHVCASIGALMENRVAVVVEMVSALVYKRDRDRDRDRTYRENLA